MSAHLLDTALTALTSVLGQDKNFPLHEPWFQGNEWEYVKSCIDEGWVSSVGAYVTKFEDMLAEYTGFQHCVAVMNGTAALHMSMLLAEVKPNDEVLLPALTFVATANAVRYCQATPHFIDSQDQNLGIDLEKLEDYLKSITRIDNNECFNKLTGKRIRALVSVDVLGHPVDLALFKVLAEKYKLVLISDSAEALGSFNNGLHAGQHSDVAVLSFNGNKIITAGGGGAILTNNVEWAKRAKHLTTTAKQPHAWAFIHDEVGYNYRLPNINAALGCAQLESLTKFLDYKRALAGQYVKAFEPISDVRILIEASATSSNYWLNALVLDKPDKVFVETFIEAAQAQKYGLRAMWCALDKLPMYTNCPKMDLSQTHELMNRVIVLPSSAQIGVEYA
jgi:perosamine synthetase